MTGSFTILKEIDGTSPDTVIESYKRDIVRTLLRESLKLTVEERFLKLMDLQRFVEELRRAGRCAEQ